MKTTTITTDQRAYELPTPAHTQKDLQEMCGSTPFYIANEFKLLDTVYKVVRLIDSVEEFEDGVINAHIQQVLEDNDVTLKALTTIAIDNPFEFGEHKINMNLAYPNVLNQLVAYLGDDDSPLKENANKDLKKLYNTFRVVFETDLINTLDRDQPVAISYK